MSDMETTPDNPGDKETPPRDDEENMSGEEAKPEAEVQLEETTPPVSPFEHGNIVWVKLGSCWWPGEVTAYGPVDESARKTTLVVVKFFNEDSYEFVKRLINIYDYNCSKKEEFIRKGMDSFRANHSHMKKFPADVAQAEVRTNGNPNILSDPMFAPKKRMSNIVAQVFGPKKSPKDVKYAKGRPSASKSPLKNSKAHVTHRRFLGFDDYKVQICIQYPGKDSEESPSEADLKQIEGPTSRYPCSLCPFVTNRLEVMMFHVQCHIKGITPSGKSPKKKTMSPKKPRKPKVIKHVTSEDDAAHSSFYFPDTESDDDKPKLKRKRKKSQDAAKPSPKVKKVEMNEQPKVDVKDKQQEPSSNITKILLSEWSDDESSKAEDEEGDADKTETVEPETEKEKPELIEAESNNIKEHEATTKDLIKSCFDFDDDDEEAEDTGIVHTAVGRKIPRVIPPTDKRKSTDPDIDDANLPLAEDDENRMEILKVNESTSNSVQSEPEVDFRELMDSTSVPELPEVPPTVQPPQNFRDGKIIKTPDKKGDSEVATKLTNPKKRFVKSFEDFELLQNEQKRAQEEKQKEELKKLEEKITVEEVSVREDDDYDTSMEIADFDIKNDAQRIQEIILGRQPQEDFKNDSNVNLTNLKCQIMSKLADDEPESSPKPTTLKLKILKSPKSKILESYSGRKTRRSTDDNGEDLGRLAPKKSKILKYEEGKEEEIEAEETPKTSGRKISDLISKSFNKSQTGDETKRIQQTNKSNKTKNLEPKSNNKSPVKITETQPAQESVILHDTSTKNPVESTELKTSQQFNISPEKTSKRSVKSTGPKPIQELISMPEKPSKSPVKIIEPKLIQHQESIISPDKPNKSPVKSPEPKQIQELITTPDKPSKSPVKGPEPKAIKSPLKNKEPGNLTSRTAVQKIETSTSKEDDLKRNEEDSPTEILSVEPTGKINSIDEYFNDFLSSLDTTTEPTKESVPLTSTLEDQTNEVHIKCLDSDDLGSEVDISIKTNLTNFDKTGAEISALTTLAMVSENLVEQSRLDEIEKLAPKSAETEMVAIDGNLTVVSEKDLADGQVEITAEAKKPVTLTNFSMDFSECNSSDSLSTNTEEVASDDLTNKIIEDVPKAPVPMEEIGDLEDHIPSQIVDKTVVTQPSKLLERLTCTTIDTQPSTSPVKVLKGSKVVATVSPPKKPGVFKAVQKLRPIILSEQIIKPEKSLGDSGSVSVQKITSQRNWQDADEIDTFIIKKDATAKKKQPSPKPDDEDVYDAFVGRRSRKTAESKKIVTPPVVAAAKKRGRAKILQQTIITPTGEIIQPSTVAVKTTVSAVKTTVAPVKTTVAAVTSSVPAVTSTVSSVTSAITITTDDNVFDINSMPIVLSDQILTPESIENMPIFLSDDSVQQTTVATTVKVTAPITTTTVKRPVATQSVRILNKSIPVSSPLLDKPKLITKPTTAKISGSVGQKLIKQNQFISSKHGKFVIVTQQPMSTGTPTSSKFTIARKQAIIKRNPGEITTKLQSFTPEPSGNKVMILTDQHGEQQRVLLTPAQQKMIGIQNQGAKLTKTIVKGNVLQKSKEGHLSAVAGSSGIMTSKVTPTRFTSGQTLISSSGHVLTPIQQTKTIRLDKSAVAAGRKVQMSAQKVTINKPLQQKTVVIKNQLGQTVKKLYGTDDALLDKQVAEQLEAIKASGLQQQMRQQLKEEVLKYKTTAAKNVRRSYANKAPATPKPVVKPHHMVTKAEIPPLAPISPKVVEPIKQQLEKAAPETKSDRPLNQLVIQDAMGNQTTITEGQILALPSETVDGQPQSYMLVTLDESGNLTPLNNEALMSLDPNLGLGGDLSNTVLQIDQSGLKEETVVTSPPAIEVNNKTDEVVAKEPIVEQPKTTEPPQVSAAASDAILPTVDSNQQQLIVTGDPIAAQKFLESLSEGSTDLANILASAEGSSILIQADGQQILINTDGDNNQMLLSVNTDNINIAESTEGGGNPIFATQPTKNQDILAAALADTDVFPPDQSSTQKVLQSQLSPSSGLYPLSVGNVLETSLTLNSPIMTPLEIPSTNIKKISSESDILTQIPKNVDLPITITDPNITQTVSQQQVASLMASELHNNLELSLPTDAVTVASSGINSPSFMYSLPSLDESVDINQKPFNASMPLLTEDGEEISPETSDDKTTVKDDATVDVAVCKTNDDATTTSTESSTSKIVESASSFLHSIDETEGLCTLGGEMCSSLSEPPPDMFDLSAVLAAHHNKQNMNDVTKNGDDSEEAELKIVDESVSSESVSQVTSSPPTTINDDSCEIPVQPEIVASLDSVQFGNNAPEEEVDAGGGKNCKFD